MLKLRVRDADISDSSEIWRILEPIIRAREAYALPRDMDKESALAFWHGASNEVFIAELEGKTLGTAFLRDNPRVPASGVANAGFATAQGAEGKGVARTLCAHVLERARALGYHTMQFNYVVSTNERAVALWKGLGFEVVEVLIGDFPHPVHGPVDVLVMTKPLDPK